MLTGARGISGSIGDTLRRRYQDRMICGVGISIGPITKVICRVRLWCGVIKLPSRGFVVSKVCCSVTHKIVALID